MSPSTRKRHANQVAASLPHSLAPVDPDVRLAVTAACEISLVCHDLASQIKSPESPKLEAGGAAKPWYAVGVVNVSLLKRTSALSIRGSSQGCFVSTFGLVGDPWSWRTLTMES